MRKKGIWPQASGPSAAAALLALAFAATAPVGAQESAPERRLTLDESIRLALLNDGRFLTAEQEIKISEQRVKEARYLFYPEIGLGFNGSLYETDRPFVLAPHFNSILVQGVPGQQDRLYSGRAYFQQTLYNGGRGLSTLSLAKAGLKQSKARYDAARLDVRLNTQRVFQEYLLAQQKSRIIASRLEESRQAISRESLGAWAKVEAETLLESLRSLEAETGHARELARLEFLRSLNLELDTSVELVGDLKTRPLTVELRKLSVWAVELRPELQSEVYQAQMDAISVNLSMARRLPSIVFGMDYEYIGNRFPLKQNNWDATIGLKLPISYDFFSQVHQRRAEQRQGQIKRAELQDKVQLELQQAWEALRFWQSEWERRREAWERASSLFAAAAKTPASGLEKARALKSIAESESRYLESVKEHLLAKAGIERAVGRPLE